MTDAYAISRARKMLARINRFELPTCVRGSIAWNCWRRDIRAVEHLLRRVALLPTTPKEKS